MVVLLGAQSQGGVPASPAFTVLRGAGSSWSFSVDNGDGLRPRGRLPYGEKINDFNKSGRKGR